MPQKIMASELKAVAQLARQVKDCGKDAAKKNLWNGVHRILGSGNKLRLHTTDGVVHLEWSVDAHAGEAEEDFDILVPAERFNAIANFTGDEWTYRISHSDAEQLTLSRESNTGHWRRILRLGLITPAASYPVPGDGYQGEAVGHRWTTPANPLASALKFVFPHIGVEGPEEKTIATLGTDGVLRAGSPAEFAMVRGLQAPPVAISFRSGVVKAVAAFLDAIDGDVEVHVERRDEQAITTFTATTAGRKLVVETSTKKMREFDRALEGRPYELYTIDKGSLSSGVGVLDAALGRDGQHLNLFVAGQQGTAILRLATPGDDLHNSSEEFGVTRDFSAVVEDGDEGDRPQVPPVAFAVKTDTLKAALKNMRSLSVQVRYYAPRFILVEETGAAEQGPPGTILETRRLFLFTTSRPPAAVDAAMDTPG